MKLAVNNGKAKSSITSPAFRSPTRLQKNNFLKQLTDVGSWDENK